MGIEPNPDVLSQTVLLLSASIDPKGMPGAISDISVRLSDYGKVLRYYLDNHPGIRKIVFVDNSGYPLNDIIAVGDHNPLRKAVEYLSFNSNDYPREYGKGYGEHKLITQALRESHLIEESSYVAKVTGRHFLINITEILETASHPFDILCDFRDHPFYEWLRLDRCGHHCDTRFIVFRPSFFRRYLEMLTDKHVRGGFSIEGQLYRVLKPMEDGVNVRCRFPIEAKYRGIAGHWGKNYSSMDEIIKQGVRGFFRSVAPWLRI